MYRIKKLAPICLFTYNRPIESRRTLDALKKNYLASESEIFIFSDGSKDEASYTKVKEVREYLSTLSGFKKITIFESNVNKGLANSVITGVSQIINEYGKVIVLEDDLITSPNFLDFMNQALDFYEKNPKIYSISGYTHNLKSLSGYDQDYYLGFRASSWGWGTWYDNWSSVDWSMKEYNNFISNPFKQLKFMKGGSDMPGMLKNQMKGKIDSWAIRWCYDQFIKEKLTVFPTISKIINIGTGESATHIKSNVRFATELDCEYKRSFHFDDKVIINKKIVTDFRNNYSFWTRLKDKLSF